MFDCKSCLHKKVCIYHSTDPTFRSCPNFIPNDISIKIGTYTTFPKDYVIEKYAKPYRIIFNYPATVVFWDDGSKTVVKCAADTDSDLYNAFCAALAKKIFGSNSHLKRIIENAYDGGVKNGR